MDEQLCEVACDAIQVSPFQPRTHFSSEEIEELAASIKQTGLIQPPVVRAIESQGKLLYYELIAGERRLRAAKLAGLKKITVIVRASSDTDAARATLIENLQRVDLDPIEMARAFARLAETFNMTQDQIADKVGKKRSTVANYLRLLTLPDQVQSAIVSGKITMGHAKALLSLTEPKMQQMLQKLITQDNLSVRETEKESRKLLRKGKDAQIEDLEARLCEALGTKVSIHSKGNKGGTLTIHYYSLDDLDALLTKFHICDQ